VKPISRSAARTHRAQCAIDSYSNAAETLGPIRAGLALFAVTRGQFSMVDAVQHVLTACAPARLSLWTWTIAEYEVQSFAALASSGAVDAATLIIDAPGKPGGRRAAKSRVNHRMIRLWQARFGSESVRCLRTHAKIATVEGNGLRVLLRGSMNLNFNPRFEQLDISEGCPAFDLVRELESGMPILAPDAPAADVARASGVGRADYAADLAPFVNLKTWAK